MCNLDSITPNATESLCNAIQLHFRSTSTYIVSTCVGWYVWPYIQEFQSLDRYRLTKEVVPRGGHHLNYTYLAFFGICINPNGYPPLAFINLKVFSTDKRTDVWSRYFLIWRINFGLWAVAWAGLREKRVWADYEQLFGLFGVKFF